MRGHRHNRSLLALSALCLSCGVGTPKAPPPSPLATTVPVHPVPLLAGSDIAGYWQWSLASEANGVRQVESEIWELKVDRRRITGTYERAITFLALDGVPFTCSQTLSYELRTVYMLDGVLDSEGISLRESDYEVSPSPCERGHRPLSSYRGVVREGRLILTWPTGAQTLRRTDEAFVQSRLAAHAPARPGELSGTWHWQSKSRKGSEMRVEREVWSLSGDSPWTGTLVRTVTVISEDGLPFGCGRSQYSYEDVYTVSGSRAGNRLLVYEVAVKAGDDPCLAHKERHLDSASAELLGDYIVLTWRGSRRQVLSRAPASGAAQVRP